MKKKIKFGILGLGRVVENRVFKVFKKGISCRFFFYTKNKDTETPDTDNEYT